VRPDERAGGAREGGTERGNDALDAARKDQVQVLGLGVAAQDCVVFEDAPAGIRSGKAAHARVLAFQTTERDELLRESGADWIVKDASAVRVGEAAEGNAIALLLRNP